MRLLSLLRPGDALTLGMGLMLVVWLAIAALHRDAPQRVIVRAGGQVVAVAGLDGPRRILAHGPLGLSVIEIEPGRARVAADPGPRQYCVKQGWLTRAGDAALCLPNQVSVELAGATRRFDSITY
ncbi:NusG domain II-containing protein [Thiobacter aerophilum]|uniref:NusG domain II-containing protein n=1 Tax=Thiobacter aerophilum TaxID=3121275 RepID=A0ABV0ECB5_9BURK